MELSTGILKGLYPSITTPLDPRTGELRLSAVEPLLRYLEEREVQGVVILGTMGEFTSLTPAEKVDFICQVLRNRGTLKVIVGTATSSIKEAVFLCKFLSTRGADAVLAIPPYYPVIAQEEGIKAYFKILLKKSPLPVILYNIPQATGVTLSQSLITSLLPIKSFVGIKDSSGKEGSLKAYLRILNGKNLYIGHDALLFQGFELGASGAITGYSNFLPELAVEAYRNALGENGRAYRDLLENACQDLQGYSSIPLVKTLLHIRGLSKSGVRPPLVPLNPSQVRAVREWFEGFITRERNYLGRVLL